MFYKLARDHTLLNLRIVSNNTLTLHLCPVTVEFSTIIVNSTLLHSLFTASLFFCFCFPFKVFKRYFSLMR